MLSLLMDLPITTDRERELRQACRGALGLAMVTIAYGLLRAPIGLKSDLELIPYMWPFVLACALYCLLGCWLYRAHMQAWRELEEGLFQRCPECDISLVRSPNGGTCMECQRHMSSDELYKQWLTIYRRHVRSTRPQLVKLPPAFRPPRLV
jgi:hypothetical protein